ncbi:MAG: aldose 1-epimerase [Burkholderiaceae bacterium]|nr:aldose 1-epimerase [Burkholderiaceae bacterium]
MRPDLGGAIAGLWFTDAHGEQAVLRSTEPAELASSRAAASYPLVPYSNRLGYRRFRWHGHEHTTAANFDDQPHSVHGVGWQRPWAVAAASATEAEMHYAHVPDAHWPFAFTARQRVELAEDALTLRLAITNTDAHAQPAGLGWHPYFPKRTRSRLHAEVSGRWEPDASGLPVRQLPQAGIDGDVAHLGFDHCFDGWQGAARLRDERLSLRLTSSFTRLVVYTPATKAYWCVEPVSHVSNAIHMAEPATHGLVDLLPGATHEGWMRLEVASA